PLRSSFCEKSGQGWPSWTSIPGNLWSNGSAGERGDQGRSQKLSIRPSRQQLIPVIGDRNRVFPLRRQRMILGDDRPAVRHLAGVALAGIDHGFDRKRHALFQPHALAPAAVMEYLWFV